MAISFGGIASGLPPNIVDIIMQAERRPVDLIMENKVNQESKLKHLGELKKHVVDLNNTLTSMTSFSSLRELKVRSSDDEILSVTVDKASAKPGVYNMKVEQLAKNASAISNGFPDKDKTEVGLGYITFNLDGKKKEIFIGSDNNTLEGIVSTIQASGLPLRASIVHDEGAKENEKYRLMIATDGEGADQNFDFPNFYFMDGDIDFYIDKESKSHNGKVMLDGFPVSVKSNKLTELIPGATIDLLDAKPNKNVSVIIEEDIEAVGEKVGVFVNDVNKILDFFESQFAINENTDTRKTLAGDTSLQSLQYTMRMELQNSVPGLTGKIKSLSDVGISFNRSARLDFDKEKFLAAANEDFKSVSEVFSANSTLKEKRGKEVRVHGVVTRLHEKFREIIYGNGLIAIKEKALRDRIKEFDRQIDAKERNLEQKKTSLKRQFANMESQMSRLKSQGQYFAQQMGSAGISSQGVLSGKVSGG